MPFSIAKQKHIICIFSEGEFIATEKQYLNLNEKL